MDNDKMIEMEERVAFAEMARDNVIAQLDEMTGRIAALRAAHGERTSALVDLVRLLIGELPAEVAEVASQKLHEALRCSAPERPAFALDDYTLGMCEHSRWRLIVALLGYVGSEMLTLPFSDLAPHQKEFFIKSAKTIYKGLQVLEKPKNEQDREQGHNQ